MKREDDQQLWDLLGRTRPVEVSPFFARNVLRKTREQSRGFERLGRWLWPRILIPATGLVALAVAAVLMLHRPPAALNVTPGDDTPDAVAAIDPQDYDVVADLDELITADESNLWDDDAQTL
ncbi:MAG TPA: hypothetical protein VFA58_03725 [Chthoniobacterales bacterium]|nr:hypothetical protein [Chthoniobacterales bacterium]